MPKRIAVIDREWYYGREALKHPYLLLSLDGSPIINRNTVVTHGGPSGGGPFFPHLYPNEKAGIAKHIVKTHELVGPAKELAESVGCMCGPGTANFVEGVKCMPCEILKLVSEAMGEE